MIRTILGIVLGAMAAFATIAGGEYLVDALLPRESVIRLGVGPVSNLPFSLKVLVVVGWLLGGLAGAAVAGHLARRPSIGWVPAGLVVAGGIVNVALIPHPLWMSIAAVVAPLLGGWLGTRLARPRPACVMPV